MKTRLLKYYTILIFFIAACISCNLGGWEKHESGLKIKFIEENPEASTAEIGDIIILDVKYFNENEEIIDENDYYRTQLNEPSHIGGSFEDALSLMHVGDSVVFFLDARNYYEKTRKRTMPVEFVQGDEIIVKVRFLDIMEISDLENERLSIYHNDEIQEKRILDAFLERASIKVEPLSSGVYVVIDEEGKAEKAKIGNILKINYTGTTIDGKIFETTLQTGKPFTFILGTSDVIQGFNEAFVGMREGTKARLIIPSKLAYAEKGYKDLILPYSTLIYNIELISVQASN